MGDQVEDQEVVREFLVESNENLGRLDREMVELERNPGDSQLLASVFRTIHTIKGTCGFLGFSTLESIAHHAENILSQVRNGERPLSVDVVTLVLEAVDAIRAQLLHIEATGAEGPDTYGGLRQRLEDAYARRGSPESGVRGGTPASRQPGPDRTEAPATPLPPAPAGKDTGGEAGIKHDGVGSAKGPAAADTTIRVDVELLDKLMDLVGELVLARNQIVQMPCEQVPGLAAAAQRLNLVTTRLQEGVMKTRMQPIGVVWGKLPRLVRDLAAACGKQIQIEMEGADTELDKSIIEAIKDPMTHMVRNCCDHGIEPPAERARRGKPAQGLLRIRAFHEGGQVNVEVSDDGGGIDPEAVRRKAVERGLLRPEAAARLTDAEALQMIFRPGFSTAETVSNISGRGVGMDVVKTNIEKTGGAVELSSLPGKGTTLRLRIPLTLAIIPGLVVRAGGEQFVMPQASLVEVLRVERDGGQSAQETRIETLHQARVCRRRGQLLPLADLAEVLGLERSGRGGGEAVNILVLQAGNRQFGLTVDQVEDTQEIVVKPIGDQLKGLNCYAGATIMGDGSVALILDAGGIGRRAGVLGEGRGQEVRAEAGEAAAGGVRQALLLFRAGSFERLTLPLSLVARLEEFPWSSVETAAGQAAVQYRGAILPLVWVRECLEGRGPEPVDPVPVIVHGEEGRQIGLVVDQVDDVVEEEVTAWKPSSRRGVVGSAVVGGRVADFADLPVLLEAAGHRELASAKEAKPLRVVLADASPFSRAVVRNYLEVEGHRVWEAGSAEEAVRLLESHGADAVLAAARIPDPLRRLLSVRPALSDIPVVALRDGSPREAGGWFDRAALVDSLLHLREAAHAKPAESRSGEREQEAEVAR